MSKEDMSKDEPRIGSSTIMRQVLKESMKHKVMAIQETPEYVSSLLRITAYKDHNKLIKDEFQLRIHILDRRYANYIVILDFIQISIIAAAAFSSFLQAGNEVINLDKTIITFISLIISAYTGLVLAVAKYLKLDEKKEAINNLRYQCAEFLTQIQTRTDKLNTWCYDRMWAGGDIKKMADAWNAEDTQLHNELKPIIEKKQALTCEFERLLDSLTVKKTSREVRLRDLKYQELFLQYKAKEDELEERENKMETEKMKKKQREFYNNTEKESIKNIIVDNSNNNCRIIDNSNNNIDALKKEVAAKLLERINQERSIGYLRGQLDIKERRVLDLEILQSEQEEAHAKLKQHEISIRPISPDPEGRKTKPLKVGDRVKSRYNNSYDYHWGEIVKINDNGTYKVFFDHYPGDYREDSNDGCLLRVPRDEIKFMGKTENRDTEMISLEINDISGND